MLTAKDLPAPWKSTPHDPSDDADNDADDAALAKCVGGHDTDSEEVAEANSPDFDQNGASVSSSADLYKSQADVDADVALLKSPKISACYEKLAKAELGTGLPAGTTIESTKFTITPGSDGGPSNVIAKGNGTLTVNASGQRVTVYIGVAFITGPLLEAEVDFENPTQPVPTALFNQLIAKVATRAAAG